MAEFISKYTGAEIEGKLDKVNQEFTNIEKDKLASLKNYDDTEIQKEIGNKVNKEDGKGLSSNDFSDEEKKKLNELSNYDDGKINMLIATNTGTIGYKKRNYLYNGSASRERYGITATVNEDGSITLNGTSTSSSAFMLFSNIQTGALPEGSQFSNNKKWISTGKYIMSQGGVEGVTLQIRLSEVANSEGGYFSCGTDETTITIEEKHTYVWCRVLIGANASFDNETIYPMIRAFEDTDISFAPYKASVEDRLNALEAKIAELMTNTTIEQE